MSKRTKGQKRKDRAKAVRAKHQTAKVLTRRREKYPQFGFRENASIGVPKTFLNALTRHSNNGGETLLLAVYDSCAEVVP